MRSSSCCCECPVDRAELCGDIGAGLRTHVARICEATAAHCEQAMQRPFQKTTSKEEIRSQKIEKSFTQWGALVRVRMLGRSVRPRGLRSRCDFTTVLLEGEREHSGTLFLSSPNLYHARFHCRALSTAFTAIKRPSPAISSCGCGDKSNDAHNT
jgi:hypothetical protein